MEPTLAQIKEYLKEKGIDIFANVTTEETDNFHLYGERQMEVYYQYYLDHSVEICEWVNSGLNDPKRMMSFR